MFVPSVGLVPPMKLKVKVPVVAVTSAIGLGRPVAYAMLCRFAKGVPACVAAVHRPHDTTLSAVPVSICVITAMG